MSIQLRVERLSKSFQLHHRNEQTRSVLEDVDLVVKSGECVVLKGRSGLGKSTLLKCAYGNYLIDSGEIWIDKDNEQVGLHTASHQQLIELRRHTIGYVGQFLRTIPRTPTIEVIAQPLQKRGFLWADALERSQQIMVRLNLGPELWNLPPLTFSGGEQQRVNLAVALASPYPLLLLDEPTASLDPNNRKIVGQLISEALQQDCAVLAILHDEKSVATLATQTFDLTPFTPRN